jgi:DNA-3-methyladenine glycosylase I
MIQRCQWCTKDSLYQEYHDKEWGTESHDDRYLFELLCLEGQQAGLSWITILKKRENYRKLFCNFDAAQVALFDDQKINELVKEPGIIRHRLKVNAIVENAKAFLELKKKWRVLEFRLGVCPRRAATWIWESCDKEQRIRGYE